MHSYLYKLYDAVSQILFNVLSPPNCVLIFYILHTYKKMQHLHNTELI